jgi:hypothetical protein
MGLRKKRPAPKSTAAKKLLYEILASGPLPVSEVHAAAHKQDINFDTLSQLSRGLVDKKPQLGPDGVRESYWSLRSSPPYVSDTPAAARKNSAAFNSGYEQALADLSERVNRICDEASGKKARELGLTLRAVLNDLKSGRS